MNHQPSPDETRRTADEVELLIHILKPPPADHPYWKQRRRKKVIYCIAATAVGIGAAVVSPWLLLAVVPAATVGWFLLLLTA